MAGPRRPPRRPVPALPIALARRASCRKRGRDGTKYSRFHPANKGLWRVRDCGAGELPSALPSSLASSPSVRVFADATHIVRRARPRSCAAQDPHQRRDAGRRGGRPYRVSASLTHHFLPNPAGFEPRMPHVSNSGPVCRCVAFPHITCELNMWTRYVRHTRERNRRKNERRRLLRRCRTTLSLG